MSELSPVEDFIDSAAKDNVNLIPTKRSRQQSKFYVKKLEFENTKGAEDHVKAEKTWSKLYSKPTAEGNKVFYRCREGKYRDKECPASIFLLYHSENCKVSLYATDCAHDNHGGPSLGLQPEMKSVVKQLYSDGIRKPKQILHIIRLRKLKEPKKSTLVTYLSRLRTEKFGCSKISGSELLSWRLERTRVPDNLDTPFVLDVNILSESPKLEDQNVQIVMSTKRLLSQMTRSCMIQIDSTYKLVWQGYPVMVFGTSDKNRVFHPFGIAVCKAEAKADFAFIFAALRKYNLEWKPEILLADASDAITNGFTEVFGPPKIRLMCFFHVLQKVDQRIRGINEKEALKEDIYSLQVCKSEADFQTACSLFIKKWESADNSKIRDFLEYFEPVWLEQHPNWFEGAAIGYSSTNNGIEATNAVIKNEHTLRERHPVGQFVQGLQDLVMKWSNERDSDSINAKYFATEPTISLRQWTKGFQWAQVNKMALKEKISEALTIYYTAASGYPDITAELVQQYKNKKEWHDFDEFKKQAFSVWSVAINNSNLEVCSCTCPNFFKEATCKHILGMQIRLRLVEAPAAAKSVPLGQKRKPGRPSLSKRALLTQ